MFPYCSHGTVLGLIYAVLYSQLEQEKSASFSVEIHVTCWQSIPAFLRKKDILICERHVSVTERWQ